MSTLRDVTYFIYCEEACLHSFVGLVRVRRYELCGMFVGGNVVIFHMGTVTGQAFRCLVLGVTCTHRHTDAHTEADFKLSRQSVSCL